MLQFYNKFKFYLTNMKPINIINNLEQELNKTIGNINDMYAHTKEPNKGQLLKALQDHIAYKVFLNELKTNIKNKIDIEKDFFKSQILNIHNSCLIVSKLYASYLKGEI
jgi:hypothetical protein